MTHKTKRRTLRVLDSDNRIIVTVSRLRSIDSKSMKHKDHRHDPLEVVTSFARKKEPRNGKEGENGQKRNNINIKQSLARSSCICRPEQAVLSSNQIKIWKTSVAQRNRLDSLCCNRSRGHTWGGEYGYGGRGRHWCGLGLIVGGGIEKLK
jgi:hypothetical protein